MPASDPFLLNRIDILQCLIFKALSETCGLLGIPNAIPLTRWGRSHLDCGVWMTHVIHRACVSVGSSTLEAATVFADQNPFCGWKDNKTSKAAAE